MTRRFSQLGYWEELHRIEAEILDSSPKCQLMMIPRLRIQDGYKSRSVEWPPAEKQRVTDLFHSRRPFRKIVVVFDEELLESVSQDEAKKLEHLMGLLSMESVRFIRINMRNPPSVAEIQNANDSSGITSEWVLLDDNFLDNESRSATVYRHGSHSFHSVYGNAPDVAAAHSGSSAYENLVPEVQANQRRLDTIAAMTAIAIGADLFISERPYLLTDGSSLVKGLSVFGVNDALSFLSLYLRSQGTYVVSRDARGHHTHTMSEGAYYWTAVWALMPWSWRWFAAMRQYAETTNNRDPLILSQSMIVRVQRSLRARDAVHLALNQTQNFDTAGEALLNFDIATLQLMGALDALARSHHVLFNIQGSSRFSGWQKDDWLKQPSHSSPRLAALFGNGTDTREILTVLRGLRNSVHGEALKPLIINSGLRQSRTLIGLPASDEAELFVAFSALGADSSWGILPAKDGRMHIDPGLLLDQLFPRVLEIVNRIMKESDLEVIDGIQIRPEDLVPDERISFAKTVISWQQTLLWQLAV